MKEPQDNKLISELMLSDASLSDIAGRWFGGRINFSNLVRNKHANIIEFKGENDGYTFIADEPKELNRWLFLVANSYRKRGFEATKLFIDNFGIAGFYWARSAG